MEWAAEPFLHVFGDPAYWSRSAVKSFSIVPFAVLIAGGGLMLLASNWLFKREMRGVDQQVEAIKKGDFGFEPERQGPLSRALLWCAALSAAAMALLSAYLSITFLCLGWGAIFDSSKPLGTLLMCGFCVLGAVAVIVYAAWIGWFQLRLSLDR